MATKKKAVEKKPGKQEMVTLTLTRDEAERLMALCVAVHIPKDGDGTIQCLTRVPSEAHRDGLGSIDCTVTVKLSDLGVEAVW